MSDKALDNGESKIEDQLSDLGRHGDQFELRELELIFLSVDIDLSGTLVRTYLKS
jgi:hypothetical protein